MQPGLYSLHRLALAEIEPEDDDPAMDGDASPELDLAIIEAGTDAPGTVNMVPAL